MIGFLLALVCFLITIPLQSIILGLKLKDKNSKLTLFDKITTSHTGNAAQEVAKKALVPTAKEDKPKTRKEKAKQALITSLKTIILLLKTLGTMFSVFGTFTIFLILIVAIILVVAIGGILAVLSDDEGGFNISGDGGSKTQTQTAQHAKANSGEEELGGTQKQVYTDNSSWVACCSTMLDWYIANVPTYQKSPPDKKGTGSRAYYPCDLLDGKGAGDDCSGFVGACLYYAGFAPKGAVPSCGSSSYVAGTDTLLKYFNKYTAADVSSGVYKPRAGDIVAKDGHVEVIADVTTNPIKAYGWGSVRYVNPRGTAYHDIGSYLAHYTTYWSLKDGVVPPSYLSGKEVTEVH